MTNKRYIPKFESPASNTSETAPETSHTPPHSPHTPHPTSSGHSVVCGFYNGNGFDFTLSLENYPGAIFECNMNEPAPLRIIKIPSSSVSLKKLSPLLSSPCSLLSLFYVVYFFNIPSFLFLSLTISHSFITLSLYFLFVSSFSLSSPSSIYSITPDMPICASIQIGQFRTLRNRRQLRRSPRDNRAQRAVAQRVTREIGRAHV